MVTHLAFIIKNGEKQKTPALNNKKRGKAKSTQKKQKHTYLITYRHTFLTVFLYRVSFQYSIDQGHSMDSAIV